MEEKVGARCEEGRAMEEETSWGENGCKLILWGNGNDVLML